MDIECGMQNSAYAQLECSSAGFKYLCMGNMGRGLFLHAAVRRVVFRCASPAILLQVTADTLNSMTRLDSLSKRM